MSLRRGNRQFFSYDVGGALLAHRFVKLSTVDAVVQAGAGEDVLGVVSDAFAADYGHPVKVTLSGVEWVTAGAAVALGADIKSDATGRAVTATVATDNVYGRALSAAAAAGDIISVELFKAIHV